MQKSLVTGAVAIAGYLFLAVGAGIAAGDADAADDAKAIQGTWTPIKAELTGQPMPEAVLKTILLKLDGENYEVSVAGKTDKGTCVQDTTTKPKRLTIKGTEGPNAGKTFLCIYELNGDTLRVCYDLSGMKTPEEFATAKGTPLYLVTYTRKKD
jgi:uncharacterized protein (TIGR03067 family)